jgi:phosphatidylinositol-3-phosphatase
MNDDKGRRRVDSAKAAALAGWLKLRDREEAAAEQPSVEGIGAEGDAGEDTLLDRYMPTPQVAAVAVMALLAAGVVLGAVTGPFAQSASAPTILVSTPTAAPEEEESAPEVVEEVIEEEAPAAEAAAEAPLAAPEEILEEPFEEAPPKEEELPFELPPETLLPPVTHLFLIVLGDQGYETAFGRDSSAPYLSETLAGKGELLQNYYAATQGDLANEIALLSGQGPTPQTAAGCPEYSDVVPGTVNPATIGSTELVEGEGCAYPAATLTLPGELQAAGQSWRAYVENGEQPAACGPGPVPFAYFHSLLDSGECGASVSGLDQLVPDLAKVSTEVPALSYIVPNACHDGSEVPCAPGQPAGLAGTDAFLETVVPEIEGSDAYKVGGMIAITFAEAPQSGPLADSSACCATPEYPGLPTGSTATPDANGVKSSGGGGRVGMLLLSPYVLPGSVDKTGYFNHFSFLRSVEELFGLSSLGYAAEPAVIPFDETVYNNTES